MCHLWVIFILFKWGQGGCISMYYIKYIINTLPHSLGLCPTVYLSLIWGEFSFTLQAYENCPPNYITLTLYNEEKSSVSYVISKAYIYTWGIITSISHKIKHIVQ